MKLHKSESPTWLSEKVQYDFREQYPLFDIWERHDRWWKKAQQNFPVSFRLALTSFIIGVILNNFFVWQGWILFTYKFDSTGAFEIIASSLEYIAGLVGVVLPIILIVVEFVSKDRSASSLIDLYLEKTTLKTTAYWTLGLLGIEAIFLILFRANIVKLPQILMCLVFLFTSLNLAIIFETGKTIWNLRNSLSNSFLIDTLSSKLMIEIRRSQGIEIEKRLGRSININVYRTFGLERNSFHNQLQDAVAIQSTKTGMLVDINLQNLRNFCELVKRSSRTTYVTKLVGDPIKKGETIAYIPSDLQTSSDELGKILERSYKIEEESHTDKEIRTLMKQVKQAVEASIRDENKPFFDELTTIYLEIFKLGVGLPIPPSTEWLNDFLFRGWVTTQIAIKDMEAFIEIAARSNNPEYIDALSYDIFEVASLMIQESSVIVDDNLSELLALYVPMYFFSHKHKNELGIHRSYFYLTRDIVDRIWFVNLKNSSKDIQAVENYTKVFYYILGTLSRILRQALSNHDLVNFKELLKFIHPEELLAHFNLGHSFAHEYSLLIRSYEEGNPSENTIVADQIKALRQVHSIPNLARDFFNKFTFLITSYLFESFEQEEITIRNFEEVLSILEPYFLPLEQAVTVFSQLVESRLPLGWDLFARHLDTKRGYFPDDEDKLFLSYCVQGMVFFSKGEVRTSLPIDLNHQLSRIERTCIRIVDASEKWKQLSLFPGLESDLSELAQKWLQLNKEIAQRWRIDYEDQIINCDLDANKIRAFTEGIEQAIQEGGKASFRVLLDRFGQLNVCTNLEKQIQIWHFIERKYFVELYEDDNYARELGKNYGFGIVRTGDIALTQFWVSHSRDLPTRKDWKSLQPYFDRAIERFSSINYKLSCFFVPHHFELYDWLANIPDFTGQYEATVLEELPSYRGSYKGYPVYDYVPDSNATHYILAIDLEKALRLNVGKPVTEIRNIKPEEIQKALSNNPEKNKKEFLLSVSVKASQPFDFDLLDREAILRMKLKLPTKPDPYS